MPTPWRRADQQGIEGGRDAQTGLGVERECPTYPHLTARYFFAFFRFAQYLFIRFDMAVLAAALIGARFRCCVAVG